MIIYTMPLTDEALSEQELSLLNYLSTERQEKFYKKSNNMGKRQCLYGPLLAKLGIRQLTGISLENISFEIGDHGKPFVKDMPEVSFNVSHTKGMLLCGISIKGKIGVDVEYIREAPRAVMRRAFHASERLFVEDCSSEDIRNLRFFQIWTQKEAYTKFIGTGIATKLDEINTSSAKLAPHYHIWEADGFVFSIYHETANMLYTEDAPEIRNVDLDMIYDLFTTTYFLH